MNTLETQVLRMIGEDTSSPDVFTDDDTGMAHIRDSLNAAIEEICMVTGSVKRRYTLPLAANHHFYRLDVRQDQIAWPTNAWLTGVQRRLERVDFNWLIDYNPRWLINRGTVERYFMVGLEIIGFHPVPSTSVNLIEIEAVVIPDRYTADDERIKIRDDMEEAAIEFAVGEFYASRGDAKNAMRHHGKYLRALGLGDLYPEQADRQYQYRTVKQEQVVGLV